MIEGTFYALFDHGNVYACKSKKQLVDFSEHRFDADGWSTTSNDVWFEKRHSSDVDADFWDDIEIID